MSKDQVELNFVYLFRNDARALALMASKESSKLKSLFARHSIISSVFAAEALINRVFDDFYIPGSYEKLERKIGPCEKWLLAPLTCRLNGDVTFDESCIPFQWFDELVKIRNWFAHPKADQFVPAKFEKNSTITLENGNEIPWVNVLRGDVWPSTRIPKNPFELTEEHAEKAINIIDSMIKELQKFMPGQVTDDWMGEVRFESGDQTGNSGKLMMASLWGGYTPEKK
ncbi:MAG: hypothetical protein Q7K71_02305 [Candidatus Omnitrophota bacterium]|nr:hypothetical protein [Candidatus Omnitrophota bacterium]